MFNNNGKAEFREAKLQWPGQSETFSSWFDMLFGGSIDLESKAERGDKEIEPRIMVISGPPSSGKTKLALELCYRLATDPADAKCCAYVSLESPVGSLRKTAGDFGWVTQAGLESVFPERWPRKESPAIRNAVWLCDRKTVKAGKAYITDQLTLHAFDSVAKWAAKEPLSVWSLALSTGLWLGRFFFGTFVKRLRRFYAARFLTPLNPDVLVIDSLNVMDPESRERYFKQFLQQRSNNLQLIVFIMDSGPNGEQQHEEWEYISDIVIRLGSTGPRTPGDYLVRTLQVEKARFQDHALGVHQLKIYGKPDDETHPVETITAERNHPFLSKMGGIFIFPSIHFYLSRFKRVSSVTVQENRVKIHPPAMESLFALPKGRCAALVGPRGTHKSRLGYMQVLRNIADRGRGLVISLRDDEAMTVRTMAKILAQEPELRAAVSKVVPEAAAAPTDAGVTKDSAGVQEPTKLLQKLIEGNLLKLLYYPPGNITPDEFFHRMFVSLQALRSVEMEAQQRDGKPASTSNILVLFNSLDQLAARFPMCAREQLFIPGMVQVFSGSSVSSIFISVEDQSEHIHVAESSPSHYGLLPMADLILRVQLDTKTESVFIRVDRNAGGEPVGRTGILTLDVDAQSPGLRYDPMQTESRAPKSVGLGPGTIPPRIPSRPGHPDGNPFPR